MQFNVEEDKSEDKTEEMIVTNPDGFPSNFGPQLNNKLYALNKEPFKLPPNSD